MLKREWFTGKRVTVFGIGLNRGALSVIRFLIAAGVKEVIATDIKTKEDLAPTLSELAPYKNITYVLGQHRSEDFTHVDMVIKNPIIPWTNEYVMLALERKIPVEMDASLFTQLTAASVIGITGTKGKTTTSSLIAHILESAGRNIVRAGISQIGFLDVLDQTTKQTTVVAELSSWRLSSFAAHSYSPRLSLITNMYPDHLNYYKKMGPYIEDKAKIFRYQKKGDTVVLNYDNEITRSLASQAPGRVVWFSEEVLPDGAEGVFVQSGMVRERLAEHEEDILSWPAETNLLGEHNRGNILAAIAVARREGVESTRIAEALKTFQGIPHRLEYIGEHKGVRFYNDTAATMPEAAIAGIRSFADPVIVLGGGADKNFQYEGLATVFAREPKAAILFRGTATDKLLPLMEAAAQSSEKKEGRFPVVSSMEEALRQAFECSVPGDVILLSPGAASFGLFQNEFDRGNQFRAAVQRLMKAGK